MIDDVEPLLLGPEAGGVGACRREGEGSGDEGMWAGGEAIAAEVMAPTGQTGGIGTGPTVPKRPDKGISSNGL